MYSEIFLRKLHFHFEDEVMFPFVPLLGKLFHMHLQKVDCQKNFLGSRKQVWRHVSHRS